MQAPDENTTPTKLIQDMLISSFLVQMSRFLVMVLVDVSTILFATVSSFPSQVVSSDLVMRASMDQTLDHCSDDKIATTAQDGKSY